MPGKDGHPLSIHCHSLHITDYSFGLTAANNRMCTEDYQIMAGENQPGPRDRASRVQSVQDWLKQFGDSLDNSGKEPVILMGDFNSPSHLDWIESTKSSHGGWTFQWPVTKMLADSGLKDSFREVHPDPRTYPGITWAPIIKHEKNIKEWQCTIPEPLDRLDYIFYCGDTLKPVDAFVYQGISPENDKPFPNHVDNEWPSDHSAVVVDFQIVD